MRTYGSPPLRMLAPVKFRGHCPLAPFETSHVVAGASSGPRSGTLRIWWGPNFRPRLRLPPDCFTTSDQQRHLVARCTRNLPTMTVLVE